MKRLLLIVAVAFLTGSIPTLAGRYNILTDKGQSVGIDDVAYFFAADNDEEFTIVLKDNSTIPDVLKVNVVEASSTGIAQIEKDSEPVIVGEVGSTLTLSGCDKGIAVDIFGLDGRRYITAVADGEITLDVSSLGFGIYVLRAGNTNVKFIKK